MLEKSALFSFARRNESAFLCFFALFFAPLFRKILGGKALPFSGKKDLNRERKKKSDIDAT
jgi:hypothetical protein